MGLPSVFLFCKRKKNHMVYMEKKTKFRPYIEMKLQFLHGLYGGNFFQDLLYYIIKNQRSFYLR